jgi:hypothetical protein
MKKTVIGCLAILMLTGCGPSIKTSDYTFTQTTGKCDKQPIAYGSTNSTNSTNQDAGRASTNSGGSGNTIIIIESSDQDAKSDPDLSGVAGSVADAVADKLTGGLTNITDVVEDLTNSGNVVEVE